MKKIIFVVHDPGGYDAVFPVVQKLKLESLPFDFYCTGPAAHLNPAYSLAAEKLLPVIKSVLEKDQLAGLVTGTSWGSSLELKALDLCKASNIPSISILDYWSNYAARFTNDNGSLIYPDHYIVMDETAAKEAVLAGVPAGILKVLGHPGLDKLIIESGTRSFSGKNSGKILFLSQPLSALYGDKLGFTEQQVLADCVQLLGKGNEKSFFVKFHPKDSEILKQQYSSISVEGPLQDILPEYDLIIGMNTMGLLHAVLMGIPAISYQPNLKDPDLCITNKLGLTRLITNYEELKQMLRNREVLTAPCKGLSGNSIIWLDGKSAERVAGFIKEVISNEY